MNIRRCHYETAFEAYLGCRGTPCVPIEDVKHVAKAQSCIKLFDYIVYPPSGPAWLVDVKGRKSKGDAGVDGRQKNWVTEADIEGLLTWQETFGSGFVASFVFAFWLAGGGGAEGEFVLASRKYDFWLVRVDDYSVHRKRLSKRWQTVSVPRAAFRSISCRLESAWPAAPC